LKEPLQPINQFADGAKSAAGAFSTTHWSVVLQAGQDDSLDTTAALDRLCQSYWYPLYVFVRRKGYSPPDAQDLTQEFFARFLEHKYVGLADQSRGKFRTFLIRSLEHFLVNEWNKACAAKRGGSRPVISWDEQEAESRYLAEPAKDLAPDKVFEKRWAMSLLETALAHLEEEFSAAHKREIFAALKVCVWGEETSASYQQLGAQLGMAEGAVKGTVHRLRQRYRELLRAEVAQTVATSAEVDEELRHLAAVLRT
jgi:RNA polymerase sigma factor (sigma-70 family)